MVENHAHNGVDTEKINAKYGILNANASALTSKNTGSLSTGGANDLKASDQAIIDNMRTRLNELETRLQSIGLIQ